MASATAYRFVIALLPGSNRPAVASLRLLLLLLLAIGLLYNTADDIKGCFYIFLIHILINIYNMH